MTKTCIDEDILYKEKVSIIIPLHNAERYIEKCVKSLINQTYKNIEIIIVENGSSDNSYQVAKNISCQDERIVLIKLDVSGVSNARNEGISISTGKYIMFCDSDDYYSTDMVEVMCDTMIYAGVDMCICNYTYDDYERDQKDDVYFIRFDKTVKRDSYLDCVAEGKNHIMYGSVCNKIYKADIIKKNKIKFDLYTSLGEDSIFNLEYIIYADKIFMSKNSGYHYVINEEYSLTKRAYNIERWNMMNKIYDKFIEVYNRLNILDNNKEHIANMIASEMVFPIRYVVKEEKKDFRTTTKRIEDILNKENVYFGLANCPRLPLLHKIIKATNHRYWLMCILLKLWFKIR